MKSSKHQAPTSRETPIAKHQTRTGRCRWNSRLGASLVLGIWCLVLQSAFAQGTAFTYQGRLDESSGPANGSYDLTFRLFDAVSGGSSQGGPLTNTAVNVSDGYFTVTLDFGLNPFSSGAARWMEIAVRTNGGGAFGLLTPRQALTPAPYAIFSGNAPASGLSGTIGSASIANGAIGSNQLAADAVTSSKLVDGAALAELLDDDGAGSGLDADLLDGLHASAFWQLGGNAGTTPGTHFLGTTDNQPLEIMVNGSRSLRLEPTGSNDTINVIGGSARNFVRAGIVGATIGGGGSGNYLGIGSTNRVESDFGTVSGGRNNAIQTNTIDSVIGGGRGNTIQAGALRSTIGGGSNHTIETEASSSTIAGGAGNEIGAGSFNGTVGGGLGHTIGSNAPQATIAGGRKTPFRVPTSARLLAVGT